MPTTTEQKYASVVSLAKNIGVSLSNVHMEGNKLLIRGTAGSHDLKNKLWDEIKRIDPNFNDVVLDIDVNLTQQAGQKSQTGGVQQASGQSGAGRKTYTVKQGDTLSEIAKTHYGDANSYMKIFEANKDKLKDPDKIQPGQELVIP